MDSSTGAECREIAAAVGGDGASERAYRVAGVRAVHRSPDPEVREADPAGYAATDRVHLVSSFMASLLVGRHAPLDPGDGSGMNLMDLASSDWWAAGRRRAPRRISAPGCRRFAPCRLGRWHALAVLAAAPWAARSAASSPGPGDNPCSLIGTGLVREGRMAISLGTSDVSFGLMEAPRVDASGTGHVFGAPTGASWA